MSLTLGEKLRQAREERGVSISQVAEQTRISPQYIAAIENDDYRTLPGGIFNKGFVKSFAKTVGVDEQEALQDYAQLIAEQGGAPVDDSPKTYRPEVLTDDGRNSSSMFPTVVFAVIILGLMTWGVLALVNYIQKLPPTPTANVNANANANLTSNSNAANAAAPVQTATPASNFKVEFKAVKADVSFTSAVDGKAGNTLLKAEQTSVFEPKESLRIGYATAKVKNVEMTINGKPIALPTTNGNRTKIEFEIKQTDFQTILDSGQIGDNFLIKKK